MVPKLKKFVLMWVMNGGDVFMHVPKKIWPALHKTVEQITMALASRNIGFYPAGIQRKSVRRA